MPPQSHLPDHGFIFGAIAGYNSGNATFSTPVFPDFSIADPVSGWDGGLLVGYEFFGDGYFSAFEIAGMFGGPNKTYELAPYSLSYGIDGHVDGRIRAGYRGESGYGFSGIVGVSYNNLSVEATDGIDTVSASEWRWGWLVGAGVDYWVTQNVSVGAEYTYNRLMDTTYAGLLTVGGDYHALRFATRVKY